MGRWKWKRKTDKKLKNKSGEAQVMTVGKAGDRGE